MIAQLNAIERIVRGFDKGIRDILLLQGADHLQPFQRIGFQGFLRAIQIGLVGAAFNRLQLAWFERVGDIEGVVDEGS